MLGRYEVIRPLASGGMADLLLARARGLEGFERHVVIKRIRADAENDQAFIDMFLIEARLAAALHHHNIVQVYDIGEENGKPYFAMEYVHGEDLRRLLTEVVRKREQVPVPMAVTIVTAVARALHHAHEQRGSDQQSLGIVHRDVSPANIIVGYDGNVKVVDFGIARAAMRRTETQAGMLKGKAPYMAPEQCTGAPVDRRSDVFGLGIVLYELVTARRLFKGDNDFSTMSMIVGGTFPKPSTIRKDLPPDLERIILRALSREPEARYQTAELMFTALEQLAITAEWRTSASALAAYMTQMFGSRTEPWLATEPTAIAVSVDFDGAIPGLASRPVDAGKSAVPTPIASTSSSPIMRARNDVQGSTGVPTVADAAVSSPIKIPDATGPAKSGKAAPRVAVTATPPRGRPKTVQVPVPTAKAAAKTEKVATTIEAGASTRAETNTEVGPTPAKLEPPPEAKPDVKPEPKTAAKADVMTEKVATTPAAKLEAKAEARVAAASPARAETNTEVGPTPAKLEATPAAKPDVKPEPKAAAKPDAKTEKVATTATAKPDAKTEKVATTASPIHEPEDTHTEAMPLPPAISPHAPRQLRPLPPPTGSKTPATPATAAATAKATPASPASPSAAAASAAPAAASTEPVNGTSSKPGSSPAAAPSSAAAAASAESSSTAVAATAVEIEENPFAEPESRPEPRGDRRSEPTEIVAPLRSPLLTDSPRARRKSTAPHDATMTPVEDTDQVVAASRPRWLVPAIGGGLVVLVIVVIAIARSGGDAALDAPSETASVSEPPKPEPTAAPAPTEDVRTEARPRTWANSQQAADTTDRGAPPPDPEPTPPPASPEGSAAGSAESTAPEATAPIAAAVPAPVDPPPPEVADTTAVAVTAPAAVAPEPGSGSNDPMPAVAATKPVPRKPATTKPATTKPATTKPATIAKTSKPPATIAKTTKPPVKKPPAKPKALPKAKWDPNTLLPNKK